MNKILFLLCILVPSIVAAQLSQEDIIELARTKVEAISPANNVYLDQQSTSADNTVTVEQRSGNNSVTGTFTGQSNFIGITQDNRSNVLGKNLFEFDIRGNVNTIISQQSNLGNGYSANYAEIKMLGNGNFGSSSQAASNTAYNSFFANVIGNNNFLDINQTGTGSHSIDITLTGNGNSVTASQLGTAAHRAAVNISNVGGPGSVTLTQQGNLPQIFNVMQQCANISGCNLSVIQGSQ